MKLFVAVMAGTDAWDAQPIFASADPDIVGAVVEKLTDRLSASAYDKGAAADPSDAPPHGLRPIPEGPR